MSRSQFAEDGFCTKMYDRTFAGGRLSCPGIIGFAKQQAHYN
jgi:hypothetical protein